MAALFGNLNTDGLEEAQDRLGGGFNAVESDIYNGKIVSFYATKSPKGADAGNIEVLLENGSTFRETIYFTNRQGENWYPNPKDKTKKLQLPGYIIVDELALCTLEKHFNELEFEDKILNIYDPDLRKDMPKSVPVAVELVGQTVCLAIQKTIEDKTKKEGDEYVPTGETREVNTIDKVFEPNSRMTVSEAKAQETEPKFYDAWLTRNKGVTRDKSSKNDNSKPGRPGASAAPQAGATTAPKAKSLFGK